MDSYLDQNSMTIRGGMVNDDGSKYYGGQVDQQLNSRRAGPRPSNLEMQQMEEARRMEEMERQIPTEAEDHPVSGPMDGPPRSVGSWSLSGVILAAIALLTIIIFIAWYFGSGEYTKGTTSSVKDIINNETDTSPTVKNLTVTQNTTLGTGRADTVNIKATMSNDLIPETDASYDLGTGSKQWGTVHVDGGVKFDDGVSIIRSTDDLIIDTSDGGLGFRRPVKAIIPSTSLSSYNPTAIESGYLYSITNDGASVFSMSLPEPTGSGIFYDFIWTDDTTWNDDQAFSNWEFGTAIGNELTGSITMVETPGGDGTSSIIFDAVGNNFFNLDPVRPVALNSDGLSQGILKGSNLRFTDYDPGQWSIDGTVFVVNGVSGGKMITPFI